MLCHCAIRRTETPVPAMHGRPPRISGRREIRLPISVTVAIDPSITHLSGAGLRPIRRGRPRRVLPPHATRIGDLLQNLVLRQLAYDLAAARAGEFRRARIERLVKAVPRAVPLCEAAAAILAAVDGLRAQVRVNSLIEIVAGPYGRRPAIEEPLRPRLALVRHLVAGADVPAGRDTEVVVCHAAEVVGHRSQAGAGETQQLGGLPGCAPRRAKSFDEGGGLCAGSVPAATHAVHRLRLYGVGPESPADKSDRLGQTRQRFRRHRHSDRIAESGAVEDA